MEHMLFRFEWGQKTVVMCERTGRNASHIDGITNISLSVFKNNIEKNIYYTSVLDIHDIPRKQLIEHLRDFLDDESRHDLF